MTFQKLNREFERLIRKSERELVKNNRVLQKEINSIIAKMYEKYDDNGLTFEDMQKYNRINKVEKDIRRAVVKAYGEDSKLTRATLRGVYNQNYTSTMDIAREESGKSIRGILKDQRITEVINNPVDGTSWADRVRTNRDNFNVKLDRTIRSGLSQGKSYSAMARDLRDQVGKGLRESRTIVRTESARVRSKSTTDALDHASNQGVEMTKTWRTVDDERVRTKESTGGETSHRKMEGVTIPYEEEFILPSGVRTFAPTQSGNAPDDVNCRCFIEISFK